MDRIRRQRAQQGMSGYGQYGPMQGPSPYAGGPMGPGGFAPPPPTRRSYNPVTGLME